MRVSPAFAKATARQAETRLQLGAFHDDDAYLRYENLSGRDKAFVHAIGAVAEQPSRKNPER